MRPLAASQTDALWQTHATWRRHHGRIQYTVRYSYSILYSNCTVYGTIYCTVQDASWRAVLCHQEVLLPEESMLGCC